MRNGKIKRDTKKKKKRKKAKPTASIHSILTEGSAHCSFAREEKNMQKIFEIFYPVMGLNYKPVI